MIKGRKLQFHAPIGAKLINWNCSGQRCKLCGDRTDPALPHIRSQLCTGTANVCTDKVQYRTKLLILHGNSTKSASLVDKFDQNLYLGIKFTAYSVSN